MCNTDEIYFLTFFHLQETCFNKPKMGKKLNSKHCFYLGLIVFLSYSTFLFRRSLRGKPLNQPHVSESSHSGTRPQSNRNFNHRGRGHGPSFRGAATFSPGHETRYKNTSPGNL